MSTLGLSHQEIMKQIDEAVENEIKIYGEEVSIVYAAYDEDEWGNPVNNLDQIPIENKVKFVSDDGSFESSILFTPTWLEIACWANRMINETKDYQNRHLKDVDVFGEEDGILLVHFMMGS